MVQARQFRKDHVDSHYASALFRYEKEFSVKYRPYVTFVCQDDKHTCKVGEPGYPVAAVERGKSVIVGMDQSMQVGDHDFCNISITPSVTFILDVPEDMDGSFYRGQVYVGVKENCFEPSPLRHNTELSTVLKGTDDREILCLYTDGGPDHRVTYISVQLSLICLFLRHNYDMVLAVRTPPYGSWKDPAERIMSILNIGLQSVGLMRDESPHRDIEAGLKKCNSMKEIRSFAEKEPDVEKEVIDSVKGVKDLLGQVFSKLSLKGKHFKIFEAAKQNELDDLFAELSKIDPTVDKTDTTAKKLDKHPVMMEFLKSHCVQRNYMFSVKKCGKAQCLVCDVPRLPPDVFSKLHHLPNPIPDGEHYKKFSDVYGTSTTEVHMPSLKEKIAKGHGMAFSPTGQTANNARLLVRCVECQKQRVIHAQKTLDREIRKKIVKELETIWYTCGTVFVDEDTSSSAIIWDVRENRRLVAGLN